MSTTTRYGRSSPRTKDVGALHVVRTACAIRKTTNIWQFPAAVLLICSLLLSACDGNEIPATGTAPSTQGTSDGGIASAFKFDPAAYRKNEVEPGAQLRVSSWGDSSEQNVVRDALARFNQVYPDVTISY